MLGSGDFTGVRDYGRTVGTSGNKKSTICSKILVPLHQLGFLHPKPIWGSQPLFNFCGITMLITTPKMFFCAPLYEPVTTLWKLGVYEGVPFLDSLGGLGMAGFRISESLHPLPLLLQCS